MAPILVRSQSAIRARRMAGVLLLLACGASACGRAPASTTVRSAQEPHVAQAGPWFEGWYTRVTDLGGGRSIATIVASHRPSGVDRPLEADDAGYINVLYSEGGQSPTRSWAFFPQKTRTRVAGHVVREQPDLLRSDDQDFRWEADGFGYYTNDHLHLDIPGQLALDMQFSGGDAWDKGGLLPLGPESYLAALPVPLHWYVKSLNAPTTYTLTLPAAGGGATTISGQGEAHLEKNWGQVFPKSWTWLQADAVADQAQVVMGGGAVALGPIDLNAWLAGYRSPKEHWDVHFSDLGTTITTDGADCAGRFHLHVTRPDLEVELRATAAIGSFGPVAVPTAKGFIPNDGAESFAADITVDTYRPRLWGREQTDHQVFHNAALEFGAASYTPSCHTVQR